MNKMSEKNQKMLLGGLVCILVILLVVIAVILIGKINGNEPNTPKKDVTGNTSVNNYQTTADGGKINTSIAIAKEKTAGDIKVTNSTLTYKNNESHHTFKVTNNGTANDNMQVKVKYIANDNSVINETTAYIGKIDAGESKYADLKFTTDVVNAKDITYEVVK